MSSSSMQALFSRLNSIGIPPQFARRALPEWWDDEIAASDSGLQQAQLYVSKAFNLDIRSFGGSHLSFRQSQPKFKLSSNVSESAVRVSAHYVMGIARLALAAIEEQAVVPSDPIALRRLSIDGAKGVHLSSLLAWCARARIPVLHINSLPGKKMTGLVVREDDKYAIVISKKGCESEILFWLAHELGHIACGHLAEDGFFADESIGSNVDDSEEKAADAYSVQLLNNGNLSYSVPVLMNARALASAAAKLGSEKCVDAGHILLNFGHTSGYYPLAKAALKELGQSSGPACLLVNKFFFEWFPTDHVSEDHYRYLRSASSFIQ